MGFGTKKTLTIEQVKKLGFVEQKSKIGIRYSNFFGFESIDLIFQENKNSFVFISYTHQLFEIKTLEQLLVLIYALTGKKFERC